MQRSAVPESRLDYESQLRTSSLKHAAGIGVSFFVRSIVCWKDFAMKASVRVFLACLLVLLLGVLLVLIQSGEHRPEHQEPLLQLKFPP